MKIEIKSKKEKQQTMKMLTMFDERKKLMLAQDNPLESW